MPSELDLLRIEKLGNLISISATLLLLRAASISTEILILRQKGINVKTNPTPSELVLVAVKMSVISSLLSVLTSGLRIEQVRRQIQSGVETVSIIPSTLVNVGAFYGLISNLYFLAASEILVNREQQINIL
ncbi:hypothetical protein GOM49_15695 [Clostridium bovifaecis]|uniref:DUF2975 domain-containing protein n=1 Tax=Clostridium bovifaecis TaxID=2184719 RepID=A0A6I6FEN3_9CLOT|nr:hypothetical protein GOM49_15695 [Clostridium bovifaecis]